MKEKEKIELDKNTADSFSKKYEKLMKTSKNTIIVDRQWAKKGDYFRKFSMYENYTPVKTSGSTTLISKM